MQISHNTINFGLIRNCNYTYDDAIFVIVDDLLYIIMKFEDFLLINEKKK